MKILLVDDLIGNLEMLEFVFKSPDYETFTALSVAAGMEILRESAPDMAIIDWMMPETTGMEMVKMIRDETPDRYVYIIMVTAREGTHSMMEALESGVDDFLHRPFLPRELRARVKIGERILAAQASLRESRAVIESVKQEWEATADAIVQLVVLLNRNGVVLRANRTAEQWGLARMTDIPGMTISELLASVYPDFGEKIAAQWDEVQHQIDDELEVEFLIDEADFGHHFQVHFEPIEH
ncbi:MAG: response regulator, partial [Chloroflexota bacterium]